MAFVQDFKAFVMRGNVVDLAVGVIIGAAFGRVVSSLVADVLMPPVGLLLGGVDFSQIMVPLRGTAVIKLGSFIQTIIDFLIVALVIFVVIKALARIMPPAKAAVQPATKNCSECAMSIPLAAKRCGHCCQAQA
jgi:large conductance mechanosensitive channel